jgi:hypothetical protein
MNTGNFSNNYGNNLFLSQEEGEAEGTIPLGQEEIRIPISISIDLNRQRLTQEKRVLASSAICPITGISISLLVPDLPILFEYENPLAKYRNAIKISQLSRTEQMNLCPSVLAGTILSLLSTAGLIERAFSYRAEESNRLLVELLSMEQLIESLYSIKKVVESKADKAILTERLPHIAFCRDMDFPVYVKTLLRIIFPEQNKITPPAPTASVPTAKPKAASVRIAAVKSLAIRRLTKSLQTEKVISNKAAGIFLWLMEAQNISTLTAEQKAKYIIYLTEKENEDANRLAVLLSKISTVSKEINLENETIPDDRPVLSFLEKLAAKKKGLHND